MRGRICMVTGATSGIGKVTARELARRGATVIVVAHEPDSVAASAAEISRATGNPEVVPMVCDLSSQASIRALVADYRSRYDRLHVLINNAGATIGERRLTVDGLETTFATNHLGSFLLTNLLLDVLRASAPARIVTVASSTHRGKRLDFDDLQSERSYSALRVYGVSKLANIVFTAELARRLSGTGVTANSLHPGVVATSFGDSGSPFFALLIKLARPFLMSADRGAETSLYLASSPEVEKVSGAYFVRKRPVMPSAEARDAAVARRLWEVSEKLTSLEPD